MGTPTSPKASGAASKASAAMCTLVRSTSGCAEGAAQSMTQNAVIDESQAPRKPVFVSSKLESSLGNNDGSNRLQAGNPRGERRVNACQSMADRVHTTPELTSSKGSDPTKASLPVRSWFSLSSGCADGQACARFRHKSSNFRWGPDGLDLSSQVARLYALQQAS
jgi:hypothetical protein